MRVPFNVRSAYAFTLTGFAWLIAGTPHARAQAPAPAATHTEKVAEEKPKDDETVWQLIGGGNLNTGNTRSTLATLGSRFLLKRSLNIFSVDATAAYGRASLRDDMSGDFGPWRKNTENLQGRVRYDRFFTDYDGVFGAVVLRRDPFAGLDLRTQLQTGYVRNFFKRENHRFWGELGYDFTYDDRYPNPLVDQTSGNELANSETQHSARTFVGYDNRVNEAVTLRTGLEALFDVVHRENYRLTWTNELLSKLVKSLQAGVQFQLFFDHDPVPGTEEVDTKTLLSLIYDLI